jgi:hypothetical protein
MSQNSYPKGIVDIDIDSIIFNNKKAGFNFDSNSLFSIKGIYMIIILI